MLDFRPHRLEAIVSDGEDVVDPITGEVEYGSELAVEFECRVSPNGSGKEVRRQDGELVLYSYLIHADKDETLIPFGTMVRLYDGETLIAEGEVLRCWANQMNMRIWV